MTDNRKTKTIVNKYQKPCGECGKLVAIGDGYTYHTEMGWVTFHNDCGKASAPATQAPKPATQSIPAKPAAPKMTNRYDGTCKLCGRKVWAGKGYTERHPGGTWLVYHTDCSQAPATPAPAPVIATTPRTTTSEQGIKGNGYRYDEECAHCGKTTTVCNSCSCCGKHCTC